MEDKGYLTESGRIVQRTVRSADPGHDRNGLRFSLDDEVIIGKVGYNETRYNLRRLLVHREWVVQLTYGAGEHRAGERFTGPTRAAAIEKALA